MLAQLKLHMLQGTDHVLLKRKSHNSHQSIFNNSEFKNMKGYNPFQNPSNLQAFEDGKLVTNKPPLVSTSRENAWMETLFDFDLWEQNNSDEAAILVSDDNPSQQKSYCDWDLEDVLVSNS